MDAILVTNVRIYFLAILVKNVRILVTNVLYLRPKFVHQNHMCDVDDQCVLSPAKSSPMFD